jgi:hypothetical protein
VREGARDRRILVVQRFGILTIASAGLMRRMRTKAWFTISVMLSPFAAGTLAGLLFHRAHPALAFAAGFSTVFLALAVLALRFLALGREYGEAFDEGRADDMARYRALIDGNEPATTPFAVAGRQVGLLEELLVREDWARAVEVGTAIDRKLIPPLARPGVLANIARATALGGDPLRAHKLASEARNEAEELGDEYDAGRWSFLDATRGIILSLLDRHEGAVELLEPIHAAFAPRLVAMNAYYLGISLREVGRREEARAVAGMGSLLVGPYADRCLELHEELREAPSAPEESA